MSMSPADVLDFIPLVVPLVPDRVITTTSEDVNAAIAPGNSSWSRGETTAETFPVTPAVIIPLVPQSVISATHKNINAAVAPGNGARSRGKNTSQAFPVA